MLIDELIDIIANYLGVDCEDLTEDTALLYEYDLDEDQLEELADIMTEELGRYVSPDMIEENKTIAKLEKAIEDF